MLKLVFSLFLAAAMVNFAIAGDPVKTGDDPLKLIAPDNITTMKLVTFKIQTTGKQVIVKCFSPNAQIEVDSSGKKFIMLFLQPGTYTIWAVTGVGDNLYETELTVTITGPIPDVPDQMVKDFQDAYNLDGADRKTKLPFLIAALRAGADSSKTATTNEDVVTAVKAAETTNVGSSLLKTRSAVGKYLNANLPTEAVTLTDDLRTKFKTEYTKVADALSKINVGSK